MSNRLKLRALKIHKAMPAPVGWWNERFDYWWPQTRIGNAVSQAAATFDPPPSISTQAKVIRAICYDLGPHGVERYQAGVEQWQRYLAPVRRKSKRPMPRPVADLDFG
jgi:hypothetical protein